MPQSQPSGSKPTAEEEEGRILLPLAKPKNDADPMRSRDKPPSGRASNAFSLCTPGGGGVYLKLPLRGPGAGAKTPVLEQPRAHTSAFGRTVSMNRLNSQQPLGGDRPIPPVSYSPQSPGKERPAGGDIILSEQSSFVGEEGSSANMSLLSGTDHLFLKKCSRFPPGLEAFHRLIVKREVMNSSGWSIYYCGQLVNKWRCCCRHEFTYHVFDHLGRTVVLNKGTQLIPGITASATVYESDGGILGTLTQACCDAAYVIKDRDGRPVFGIRGPCYGTCTPCVFWCFDEHFELTAEDGVTEIGVVSTHWKKAHPDQDSLWGLQFPIALEPRQKALLLGAAFLVHFQYYHRGGNGVFIFLLSCVVLGALLASFFTTDGWGFLERKNLDIVGKPS